LTNAALECGLGWPASDLKERPAGRGVYLATPTQEEAFMHKDQVDGVGKQVKGAVKDAAGGLTGNERLQAEGKLDKAEGKIQQKVGEAKDNVRDALKR